MKDKSTFKNPPKYYNPNYILHNWTDLDITETTNKVLAQGYGGFVTNPPFENHFTKNTKNLTLFSKVIDVLDSKEIPFWIYDEAGYPSGQAGGLTLEDHPEFASKGMFMYKRLVLTKTRVKYHLPDEADKIVWAAKYKFGDQQAHGRVDYSTMQPIKFDTDYIETVLEEHEALYVFCVKTTHEGTHGMHNACSQRQNINIMDKRAVRRFIDVAYEPIAKAIPNAYSCCQNVFTDEPSLFLPYTNNEEWWPYACTAWVDGLFQEYEKEYGESLLPSLPLLFEGTNKSWPIRVKFYELVGKLISEAYTEQLSNWCNAHGCGFSGHYLSEENIGGNVAYYGNLVRVLQKADYPGFDILCCFPEIYQFVNAKIPQMAMRKSKKDGLMVELCPHNQREEFMKTPFENMKCVTALCYLAGARTSNSYFNIPLDSPDSEKMRDFNEYTGRIGYILDGLSNDCDIFVYYPIEDAQAKYKPYNRSCWVSGDTSTRQYFDKLVNDLQLAGFDFYLADFEDIAEAHTTLTKDGIAKISNFNVKTIIIPKIDTIYRKTLEFLKVLSQNGVRVIFTNGLPSIAAEDAMPLDITPFSIYDNEAVLNELYKDGGIFVSKNSHRIIRGKFQNNNKTIYMLVNMDREDGTIIYNSEKDGEIWFPDGGNILSIKSGDTITVPACRAIFVVTNN